MQKVAQKAGKWSITLTKILKYDCSKTT